jgi:hypothetical protein
MNLASALVGAFLIWAAGLAWGFPIGALLYQYFRIGTFNPGFWIISLLFVVVVTIWPESNWNHAKESLFKE